MADPLETRYRRLLVAYPRDYREARGDEIVATLLDLAGPDRRRPSLADTADLLVNGVRRRLGTASVAGLESGLVLAAPFALAIAAGISAYAWWRVEPLRLGSYPAGTPLFGVFRSLGPIAYAAWLIAALARSVVRPAAGRIAMAIAIAVTLLLPAASAVTSVDRPPLWVLTALIMFGGLALAGTSVALGARRPSADERLAVPAGAVAVAVAASAVVLIWPPTGGGFGYYYQPTIARVGTVVAATVATVAGVAIWRLVRRRPAYDWLWAAALLGLPAGWIGPFDSASLRLAAAEQVPRFGRLAQVLLATCLAVVAMVWLVRRTRVTVGAPRSATLERVGAGTLGFLAGLVAFVLLGAAGMVGFARTDLIAVPVHVLVTGLALLAAGGLAWAGVPVRLRLVAGTALAGLLAAWLVAAYDNGWTLAGWRDFAHTTALVATLGVVAMCACAASAARAWGRGRFAARPAAVLVVSLGWLGYATLPYLLAWGPVLLVLIVCCAVLALTSRRSSATPR